MIQVGRWAGYYSFSDKRISTIRGFEKTNFEIEILSVENNIFTGTIQDDLSTGGTEGVGEVEGRIMGNKIVFVKRMPIMTLLVDNTGTRKTLNKKHSPIYYEGQFSSDGKSVAGTWKFRFGFIWLGIIPVPTMPSKGTWSMKLKE